MDSLSVDAISHEEADKLSPHGGILWGTNAQEHSQRARSLLGWAPTAKSLEEEIPDTVQLEARKLGVKL